MAAARCGERAAARLEGGRAGNGGGCPGAFIPSLSATLRVPRRSRGRKRSFCGSGTWVAGCAWPAAAGCPRTPADVRPALLAPFSRPSMSLRPRRRLFLRFPLAAPPGLPARPFGHGRQPDPGGQHRADVGEAGQRGRAGLPRVAARIHSGRGQPAPCRAGGQYLGAGVARVPPAGGDGAQPGGPNPQRRAEQIVGGGVLLGDQAQSGDVAAGEPDEAGVGPPHPRI